MGDQAIDFGTVWAAWDQLLAGAGLTLLLTVQAIVFGMAIAIPAAWAKTAGPPLLRRAVDAYVEIIRNTPFLLQLYFFFFGLPSHRHPAAADPGGAADHGDQPRRLRHRDRARRH